MTCTNFRKLEQDAPALLMIISLEGDHSSATSLKVLGFVNEDMAIVLYPQNHFFFLVLAGAQCNLFML